MTKQWVIVHRWPSLYGDICHSIMPEVHATKEDAINAATFYNDHDSEDHNYFAAQVNTVLTVTNNF